MERVNSVSFRAEIDTNKQTYTRTFSDLVELVEWWNAHAEDLELPTYSIIPDDDADPEVRPPSVEHETPP